MTEKRLIVREGDYAWIDTVTDTVIEVEDAFDLVNALHDENYKIKSLLLKKVKELNNDYNKSAKAGMPTGGIIGELDSFEEICRVMGWIK